MITEDQKRVLASARQAVQDNPECVECQIALGEAYFDVHDYKQAVKAFEQALALDSSVTTALNRLGHTYYRLREPDRAIAAYERSIEISPRQDNPYYGLGVLYTSQLGNYEAGLASYKRALTVDPENAFFVACLGMVNAHMGKLDDAIANLERSIDMQPRNPFAFNYLSIVYLHQHDFDKVIETTSHVLANIPNDHNATRMLGYAYFLSGNEVGALYHLEHAIDLESGDFEVRALLSRLYRKHGLEQQADEAYAIALETATDEAEYGEAGVAVMSGDIEGALSLLGIALETGQLTKGWARIDPEFAFFMDDPRYLTMVAE